MWPGLDRDLDFSPENWGFRVSSNAFEKFGFATTLTRGKAVNFVPAAGSEPELANRTSASISLNFRPLTPLRIRPTYLLSRLTERGGEGSVFNNHIARLNLNWQFTRELSFRFITQYEALLTAAATTALETTKNLNVDFLFTYLLNPRNCTLCRL